MRFGLRERIIAFSAVLVVVVGAVFAILLVAIGDLRDSSRDVARSEELLASANTLQRRVVDIETGVRGYLLGRDDRFLSPFTSGRAAAPAEARQLARRLADDPLQQTRLEAIQRELETLVSDYAEPTIRRIDAGERIDPRATVTEGKRRVDALRTQFSGLLEREQAKAMARRDSADDNALTAVIMSAVALGVILLLVLAFAAYLSRAAVWPIRSVAESARRVAGGDLSARVEERGAAEAGELSRSFNSMAGALQENRDELESQNAELERQQSELEQAVEELAREKRDIEILHAFGQRLTEEIELEPLAEAILTDLCRIGLADVGALYARGREERSRDGATRLAVRGMPADALPTHLDPGEGLAGQALAERRSMTTLFGESDLRVQAWGSEVPVRAEAHIPLRQSDRHMGVVSLGRVADVPFTPDDIASLELLASQAAIALSNARALQVARHQARLNRAVLETARDAFIAVDQEMVVTQWNPAAELLLGYTREEALGHSLMDLVILPERLERSWERVNHFLAAGGDDSFDDPGEFPVRHKHGHEVEVEMVVSPLESDGRWIFNLFLRDVGARKREERLAAARSAVNRELAEAADLEEAEAGVLAAVGQTLGFQLGAFWRVPGSGEELRLAAVWAGEEVRTIEFEARSREARFPPGTPLPGEAWEARRAVWVSDIEAEADFQRAEPAARQGLHHAVAVPAAGHDGVVGVLEFYGRGRVVRDDSMVDLLETLAQQVGEYVERRESERQAERLKDQFFALVSHELRTPLTSIIGYLELVLEDAEALDERDRRFLNVVDRNAKRLLRLVGDLLFVAHVEAGRLALEVARVDLDSLTVEAVEAARPRAEARTIALEATTAPVPSLAGDRDRLGQVLDNLIGNALKFTPEGGRVIVRLREQANDAVIEVSDTGVGIPVAEQAKLFERFFRATTATDRAIPGVGLGLTIAKAIVDAHGGTIEVESVEGAGTTFRVRVPLDRRPRVSPVEDEAAGKGVSL